MKSTSFIVSLVFSLLLKVQQFLHELFFFSTKVLRAYSEMIDRLVLETDLSTKILLSCLHFELGLMDSFESMHRLLPHTVELFLLMGHNRISIGDPLLMQVKQHLFGLGYLSHFLRCLVLELGLEGQSLLHLGLMALQLSLKFLTLRNWLRCLEIVG